MKSFKQFCEKSLTNDRLKTVVVSFGRMNPPTLGHLKLMNAIVTTAKKYNGEAQLYLSHSQDSKKNPIDYNTKLKFVKKLAPSGLKVVDSPVINIFQLMKILLKTYQRIIIVTGSDNISEYQGIAQFHAKDDIEVEVVSAGERDPDADGAEGMSATKMRQAVINNDYKSFKMGTGLNDRDSQELFYTVKKGMEL